ncbi:alpha-L-rhamnosidase-related protein [Thermoflexibacter ruber]|uniref:Alpha-L-rhamnosidase N-terminal domain-containing protein n=1 Tax=Thermoflexibacter ruber TaxID=1003 RepID=A0A1I2HXW7_9BACT|nr:alpha-L-rhamnosidase N-terminal domain-containing protein [Thermoflexibacter ruber]SFF34313.1 Alpha-L-rhamnosidase N-terminal domain-containing protein [Thermoflexibacter ruber]
MILKPNRRKFLQQLTAGTSLTLLAEQVNADEWEGTEPQELFSPEYIVHYQLSQTYGKPLNLTPAQWIWLPAGRTLPNTFLLFRKVFTLNEQVSKATGWILGESRYKLYLNAERIQWGPAPFDPRWAEADPMDLTGKLIQGNNIIGVEVLYYGFGDGTMPIGKPGFIFKLDIEYASGRKASIISDETWQVSIADAWRIGQYKRWYLRSLQEEFDARWYPYGWNTLSYLDEKKEERKWYSATRIAGASADKPVIASWARDYLYDAGGANLAEVELRQRSVPMLKENLVPIKKLSEQSILKWKVAPDEFFQFNMPESICFTASRENFVISITENQYVFEAQKKLAYALTFEFEVQSVGFPYFTIETSEGTIVELLVHEGHDTQGDYFLLNTHFNSWSKFTCKAGINKFEIFDYESLRWLQLHVHNAEGTVKISEVGMRRREYPFANPPQFKCSDKKLEKLFDACVNTIYNNSQETIVDGMARERQQYSGDIGHILHGIARGFGDVPILVRYLNTYSQGLTKTGFFLDTWPAYDRLARLMEREIGITEWGPLLDHGVGFNFDCYYYYLYHADTFALQEVYPRLKIFFNYLKSIQKPEGTMPVENLGIPTVWIDHIAYKKQKHKECAFSLYVAGMCREALSKLALAMNEPAFAKEVIAFGEKVLAATQKKFWDEKRKIYICNKPWIGEENEIRYCDRSLSMAVLYGLNIGNQDDNAIKILAETPNELGISYPTNAVWRYWALAKGKRIDILLKEFRTQWYEAPSVQLNNVLAEFLEVKPDTNNQWSHASIAPFFALYIDIAGVKPLKAGYEEVEIAPQLADIQEFSITNYTIKGAIYLDFKHQAGKLKAEIHLPEGIKGVFVWKDKKYILKSRENKLEI